MSRCRTCHRIVVFDSHVCPPLWEVREVGAEWSEAVRVYASDANEAAEEYARRADENGDYEIVGGRHSPTVLVRLWGEDDGRAFEVTGEAVPQYTAREKTP